MIGQIILQINLLCILLANLRINVANTYEKLVRDNKNIMGLKSAANKGMAIHLKSM